MPQTRFVTRKAFEQSLPAIVVINKIDRPEARPHWVESEVLDLFDSLGASEQQLDFPTVFTSAKQGTSGLQVETVDQGMDAVLNLIVDEVQPPSVRDGAFQMQISTLDYSPYVGVIGIGRVVRGQLTPPSEVSVVARDGTQRKSRIQTVLAFQGLERKELREATSGDIVSVVGIDGISVSDTVCDLGADDPLPALVVEEPTLTMSFGINTSPLAGESGKYLTSGHLRDRLFSEASHNVSLRVTASEDGDTFEVSGRGELHLAILIETMRREGYELAVSRPQVITREVNGQIEEPFETIILDIDVEHQGRVMDWLGDRRGDMLNMVPDGRGRVRLDYRVPTRGLLNSRSAFSTITSGSGVMTFANAGYHPVVDNVASVRQQGVLVSNTDGRAVAYALFNLQNRGRLLVSPGTEVYPGMIIGIHSRGNDLVVNPTREKKLSNVRAAGSDENVLLTPPLEVTLDTALEMISDDELVEVTPDAIRLRKKTFRRR